MPAPRRALIAAALAAPLAAPCLAQAPARPLRIVVSFPPGGSNDLIARILQPRLAAQLGQPVVVENRAGGSGSAGSIEVARSAPDGLTWLLVFDGEATNQTLLDLPYRALDAFVPVGRVAVGPIVLAAHAGEGWRDLADLAAAARARPPGAISYATTGVGGIPHLAMLAVEEALGLRLTHTAYRGAAQAVEDVTGGFVQLIAANLAAVAGPLRDGAVRALAVTTAEPSRHLPGVRTLAGQGVRGVDAGTWWMLLGRAGTPQPLLDRMAEALAAVLVEPETRRRLEEEGVEVAPLGPVAARALLAAEIERWGAVIRARGIRPG